MIHANTDMTHHCSARNVFLCVLRDLAGGKVGKQGEAIRKHNGNTEQYCYNFQAVGTELVAN